MNRETRKLIIVFRDLRFLIAMNCARDPPLRPLIDVGPRTGFFLMKLREDDHDHHSEINWYYYYPLIQGILFVAFASRSCTELVRVKGTCNHNVSRSSVICKLLAGYAAFIKKFPPIASLRKATNYNTVHPAMRGETQARPDGVHQTC